jgi:hypothetical protein
MACLKFRVKFTNIGLANHHNDWCTWLEIFSQPQEVWCAPNAVAELVAHAMREKPINTYYSSEYFDYVSFSTLFDPCWFKECSRCRQYESAIGTDECTMILTCIGKSSITVSWSWDVGGKLRSRCLSNSIKKEGKEMQHVDLRSSYRFQNVWSLAFE